jgi:hypothetical protein
MRPNIARHSLLSMAVAAGCLISCGLACGQGNVPPGPSPDLTLTVNQTPEPQTLQGEPLIVTVVLSNPGIFGNNAPSLQIDPLNGSWANTVQLAVTNAAGSSTNWVVQLVAAPPGALLLDNHQIGVLKWVVAPADSANIAPGTYQVSAAIDTTASAGTSGWKGTANSDVALVQVSGTSTPSAAQIEQKLISEAMFDDLQGNDVQAVSDLDQLLSQNPTSIRGLQLKGAVLTKMGQTDQALAATEQALNAVLGQDANPQEPPKLLFQAASSLRNQIYGGSTVHPLRTTTTAQSSNLVFNPVGQIASLSAVVTASSTVTGGAVTFSIGGIAGSTTSPPLTAGSASAVFTVPGGTHVGSYTIEAAYGGTATFGSSSDSTASLTITPANSIVTWNHPADMHFGVPLGAGQLNATANIPGTFVYTPQAGTLLPIGKGQVLTVKFIPGDALDYNTATATVMVNVVAVPGDLNGDGVVNCTDLAIVKAAFGRKTGQAGYDPRADVNGDGVVNILDLSTVARQLPAGITCK